MIKKKIVGGAFVQFSKNFAQYSVGAYDRKLFNQPIAHPVQMKVIEYLKKRNNINYYLGDYLNTDDNKLNNIILFKKGFSNSFILEREYLLRN